MQKTIFFIGLLLGSISLSGQSTFHKKFHGGGLFSYTPLSNGGILGVGQQSQPQNPYPEDGLLVRFSHEGDVVWKKRYPTMNAIYYSVETENGFVIIGDSIKPGSHPQPRYSIVSKLTSNGDVIWSKIIGEGELGSIPVRLIKVPNGYFIYGRNGSTPLQKLYLTKIDEDGNTLWSKTYSLPLYGVESNPSFITEGDTLYSSLTFNGSGCFSRFNLNTGDLIDISSFGGIYFDGFTTVKATQDSNFILAGLTRSTTGSEESRPWVVKVNRTGQIIWSKTYNLSGTSLKCFMTATADGGFVLSMSGDNVISEGYAILAKIDASGNLLWAYDYSVDQYSRSTEVESTVDGGILAKLSGMLKVDNLGRVANGCCPAPVAFQVEDFIPVYQTPIISAQEGGGTTSFSMYAISDQLFTVSNVCDIPMTSIIQQVLLCQGDSIQINGTYFQAPNTIRDTVQSLNGGCDTVRVFNLVQIPQPFLVNTISFCPGNSVMVNGINYTHPDTISQIIPATTGCDTLLVTFLEWKVLPQKYQTTTFCPGDTVLINGISYQFPGIVPIPDTLPGAANACDTLLYHVLAYPAEPSSVSVHCPADVLVSTAPATPIAVNYLPPTAVSDCICPDLSVSLAQGLSSGATFPVGNTLVCYSASDICGASNTCCFEVKVEEEAVCDVKESGCVQYEMLGISVDTGQNKTYRVRVTNDCASPMSYVAFQLPNGLEALAPAQNSTYTSPNGFSYSVRNPNYSPFRSVRFKPVGNGISAGQSDVFEYTLPAQISPVFIKAATRLASGAFHEVTLNTFDCILQLNNAADRTSQQPALLPKVRVFPNPNSGEIFVDLSEWEIGMVQWRVLNMQGQEMAQSKLESEAAIASFTIPKTLPDGLYFFEIKSENGETQTTKFVLRR